ncbi:uncharacterized protein LOC135097560 isoform X1 [Scylla paramamosain]|uniref:uncharacterized protein LOC135097560 isoform X1 n=1 Tax=Scylla paramamosain TaxID=85552 RepID=UPI003082B1B9
MQLEAHHLKAAERPDQSGSCVKYCRPAAAVWECAAFWIKDNLHDRGWTVRTLDLCNYSQLQRLCPSADQDHHQLVSLPQAVLGHACATVRRTGGRPRHSLFGSNDGWNLGSLSSTVMDPGMLLRPRARVYVKDMIE